MYTAPVTLSASASFVDPITYWGNVFATTQGNVAKLVDVASENPFPVLNQVIENQARYANAIGTALSSAADGLYQWAEESIGRRLPEALNALAQGDLLAAAQVIKFAVTDLGIAAVGMLPLLSLPYEIAQNVANMLETMAAQGADTGIIGKPAFGLLNLANTMVGAAATFGQALVDATEAGDPVTALSTIVNAPAFFTDCLLNGQAVVRPNGSVIRTAGLLSLDSVTKTSWSLGSALLVHIPRAIAAAITPPATTATDSMAIAAAPARELPTTNSPVTTLETAPASDPAPATLDSPLDNSPEPGIQTEHDATALVSASSPAAKDVPADTATKSDTAVSLPAKRVRASLHDAADQAGDGVKKLTNGIEKSVKKFTDSFSKVRKKEGANNTGTRSAKKAKAANGGATSSDKKDNTGSED
ncbi:hypothetical protein [Mycolicibacterium setense]|uniref:hypothetical protein n=1 Tax=Mycolicibacterium setense TaxID=431269 RepID=UPI0005751058|nr:hypothetical protein [Mycolicibacterium setense]KHO23297.1 hypothetical protein QQ25_08960 [Mycolicibacterium setense]MCV7115146.1 hypothetical protein [Mycolicibacterium setense]